MDEEKSRLDMFRAMMGMFVRKWTVEIMYCLYQNETMRFSEIRKMLRGVSSRTLSDRLKELEDLGLVKRTVFGEKPIRVEYKLTPSGKSIGEEAYMSLSRLLKAWEEAMAVKEKKES